MILIRRFRPSGPWPFGATAIFLLLILAFRMSPAAAQDGGIQESETRAHSLSLVNRARAAEGLPALEMSGTLIKAAEAHARDMLARDYFSHVTPDGRSVMARYISAGGDPGLLVAENIARCKNCVSAAGPEDIEDFHRGWMNSEGHRENILAGGLDSYGFAIVQDGSGARYAVQTFAGPSLPLGVENPADLDVINPAEQTQIAARIIGKQRSAKPSRSLASDQRLIKIAQSLIPDAPLADVKLDELRSLKSVVGANLPWRSYRVLAGRCSACGVDATRADVRFFVQEWLASPAYRAILSDTGLSTIGMTVRSDGSGRKVAVAVLAGQ